MRSLEHSRLVHMLETGVTNGHPYLMMPYFQGGNLEDLARARGGRLPVGEAVTLMTAALEGLAYMHERAFVHRDVKPGNLLVDGTGGAVVADFGIAKSFVDAGLSDVTSRTGTPFGTPAFMAREQVTNYRFVHPATDVWAASATLYYLITGEAPRDARAHRTAVDGILTGSILPVRAKRADVPNRVGTVIDKALAVEVEDRYPDAGAFLAALRRAAR